MPSFIIIGALFFLSVLPLAHAEEGARSSEKARQEASDIEFKTKSSLGVGLSESSALAVIGRVGVDINRVVEAGVEGHLSPYGVVGGGLYAKVPLDGEKRWYGIVNASHDEWYNSSSNNRSINTASVGVGREFANGAFIEARVGRLKRSFQNPCRHNDYGTCVDGGSESGTTFMLQAGVAF